MIVDAFSVVGRGKGYLRLQVYYTEKASPKETAFCTCGNFSAGQKETASSEAAASAFLWRASFPGSCRFDAGNVSDSLLF